MFYIYIPFDVVMCCRLSRSRVSREPNVSFFLVKLTKFVLFITLS